MGAGLLLELPSVVGAATCFIELYGGMAERNVAVPEGRRINFRVGINQVDIVIDRANIHGDGADPVRAD